MSEEEIKIVVIELDQLEQNSMCSCASWDDNPHSG